MKTLNNGLRRGNEEGGTREAESERARLADTG